MLPAICRFKHTDPDQARAPLACARVHDVRIDRIQPRRYKHPRSCSALLVYIVDYLRVPDVMQLTDCRARLLL